MSVEPNEEPLIRWDVAYSPEQMAAAYNRLRAMYDAAEARAVSAERERDELRAAQGWRTIDSAPRDGTKVDLWSRSHYGDGRITDAWYVGNEWFVFNDIGTPEAISHHHHVTHWQPLPSPPTR